MAPLRFKKFVFVFLVCLFACLFESGTRGNDVEMQKLWSVSERLITGGDNERRG